MKKLFVVLLFVSMFFMTSANCFGSMVGDAPNPPYEWAGHGTAEWQRLGASNLVDDGVWWSTDGGSTWGHNDVQVGDQIKFRFALWSAGYGNHVYDQIKAWVDWDQNGNWDNNSEVIIADRFFKVATDPDGDPRPDIWNISHYNDQVSGFNRDSYNSLHARTNYFVTGAMSITDQMIGGLWLRARVSCDETPFDTMGPYGWMYQGEVEDWSIPVNSVPLPASAWLLSTGIVGLIGYRRKKDL